MGNVNCTAARGTAKKAETEIVRSKKNDQGRHECEVLGRGPEAAESATAWRQCCKNPKHKRFIPVDEFHMDHLPGEFRRRPLMDMIENMSARTVKIRVGYTSTARPEGYTFSEHRGTDMPHVGSGWLQEVRLRSGPCPCRDCARSSRPHTQWCWLAVETACHVVYNSEEARSTKVDFFYDGEQYRLLGEVETVSGVEVAYSDVDGDRSTLLCATHDVGLAQKLYHYIRQGNRIWKQIKDETYMMPIMDDVGWSAMCVVVAHPHGQPKMVTVGHVMGKIRDNESSSSLGKYTYTTDTCPGSSGAPVWPLSCRTAAIFPSLTWQPHSEAGIEGWLNMSGRGLL